MSKTTHKQRGTKEVRPNSPKTAYKRPKAGARNTDY